jgi:soluble lytic murein transglycosylase-like protein
MALARGFSRKLLARHAVTAAALAFMVVAPLAPNADAGRVAAAIALAPLATQSVLDLSDLEVARAAHSPVAAPWISLDVRIKRYARSVDAASRAHGVDPALVHAMIFAESTYDPDAVSPVGAVGLMQLMPETARRYGVQDPFDPHQNIRGGVRYLKDLLVQFDGDVELAVAAYNSGPGAVVRAGHRIPDHPETVAFVPRVMAYRQRFQN